MRTLVLFLSITCCLSMTCQQIRTVYNDRSCCRDSPKDTCLRTMPMCNETSNTSVCTEDGIPTIKVDNTTIFLNENGTLYTTSSGSGSSTNISVDNTTIKQYANGTIYAVGGGSATSTAVVTREGQVLEELAGICSGQTVKGVSGTYTWPDVTQSMSTVAGSWTTITGSEISYKPPVGTTEVVYTFNFIAGKEAIHHMVQYRFSFDGNIVTKASPATRIVHAHTQGVLTSLVYVITVGGTTDYANGIVASWDSAKTVKIEAVGDDYWLGQTYFHRNEGIDDGTGTNVATTTANELVKPNLNIRAIGVQLNYVNFEPTPTALLSAQTFEVTQTECASTALVNSIKAQFATMFPQYTYGTLGNNVYTSNKLPHGCMMHIDTGSPDYTRVFWNPDTTDADNKLGSGYSSQSMATRICKYANGDFVLLTDPTARCKTVHFTLPDNLNTLAGVLQTDSTKLGIGIAPEASFHIGLSENVDVNVSRFECDGSGAIIEQTSGEVTTVMSQSDCAALTSYQSTVPAVSAVKKYDGYCSTSTSNSPYNYNVVEVTSGSPDSSMTATECLKYAIDNNLGLINGVSVEYEYTSAQPYGCWIHQTNVRYNTDTTYSSGVSCGNMLGSYPVRCLQKLNVKELTSGTPPNDVSEAECKAYGESIGKWERVDSFTSIPSGCFRNGEGHPNSNVYYNTHVNNLLCSTSRICIAKDTTYDNPGTTDQQRIDACRNACTNRSIPLFSGSWDFRSASFWVEPTGGECHCGAEPAGTCATTASDFIDLYELNNPPKGCFRDSSGNHYHNAGTSDDNYGVCSTTYKCLRNDEGCLVQDQTNETKSISLISEQSAWFKNEIIVSSDQRIKTNITHVDNALSILREIPTRYYDYVDHRRGSSTIGFIAQEVAQVLPSAVKKQKGYIPSHMKRIACVFNYTDALRIHCPELDDDKKYKLYVSNPNEGEKAVEIRNHGVIDKVYTSIYCFGEEVEDFHVLEKSKLFAIAFSATQELDKLVSTLRQEVDALKAKVYGTV